MFNHSSHAVRDDEMIRVAIEYNQRGKNAASEIIKAYTAVQVSHGNQSAPQTIGGLFLRFSSSTFKNISSRAKYRFDCKYS